MSCGCQDDFIPWDYNEVVTSIHTLYGSSDAAIIHVTQEKLLDIQKDPLAARLGLTLLNDSSHYCKYFGALTLTVYINTHLLLAIQLHSTFEDSDLACSQARHIFSTCLNAAYILHMRSDACNMAFVIRKLLSVVVLLFSQVPLLFSSDPATSLVEIFFTKNSLYSSISNLPNAETNLLCMILTTIAEDLCKLNVSKNSQRVHMITHDSVFPIVEMVLKQYYAPSHSRCVNEHTLNTINSWIVYVTNAESISLARYSNTECLVEPLISEMIRNIDVVHLDLDEAYHLQAIFDILTEVVETNLTILRPFKASLHNLIFCDGSPGARYAQLILLKPGFRDEYESCIESFVNFISIFLSSLIIYISRHIVEPETQLALRFILDLSRINGIPTVDECISEQLLVFWEEFVDVCHEDSPIVNNTSTNKEEFEAVQSGLLHEITTVYWQKIRLFDGASQEFMQYRCQVADLFISIHSILKIRLYSMLCDQVASSSVDYLKLLQESSAKNLEASLFLLSRITGELSFFEDSSRKLLTPLINKLFESWVIEAVALASANSESYTRLALLNFLSTCPFFFKTDQGFQFLAPTFKFLFSIILDTSNTHSTHSLIASKAVLALSQDTQDKITVFLPEIGALVVGMLKSANVDNLVRERMVHSYIAISQSSKQPQQSGQSICELLQLIRELFEMTRGEITHLKHNEAELQAIDTICDFSLSLLSCINEMGKATQLPDELELYASVEEIEVIKNYWEEDPLRIQDQILRLLDMYANANFSLSSSTLAIEKCCSVLLKGLSEPIAGPFKFPLSTIVTFISLDKVLGKGSSTFAVYKLAETVINSTSAWLDSLLVEYIIDKLVCQRYHLLEPETDLIKAATCLFSAVLTVSPQSLLGLPSFSKEIFSVGLMGLRQQETFVIKAAAKFWTSLLTLRRGNQQQHQFIHEFLMATPSAQFKCHGESLVEVLLMSFLENPRSNIEHFYTLFRTIVSKFPLQFKTWMGQSLSNLRNTDRTKVSMEQGDLFLKKLMLTRGQRQASDVLKELWLKHNQLVDYQVIIV